ncbi:hypothetical protein HYS96_00135 [Candidatus Daviesbacteria bacterium]|nr:hypothetical protein [Candidatus Daviesbacteria bacterium]
MRKITPFLKENLFLLVVISVLVALSTIFIIWNKTVFFSTKTVTPPQIPLANPPIQTQSQLPLTPLPPAAEANKTEVFLEKVREAISAVVFRGLGKSVEPTPTPGVSSQGSPTANEAGSVPLGTKPSQDSVDTASTATEPKSAFSPKPVRIP